MAMRKTRWITLGVVVLCLLAVGAHAMLGQTQLESRITMENYHRIKCGETTESDVQGMLGFAGTPTDRRHPIGVFGSSNATISALEEEKRWGHLPRKEWTDEGGSIIVLIDEVGTIQWSSGMFAPPPEPVWVRFYHLLGL
jgi:hypothetical protein